ncbi:uncharacterized protein N7473_011040 [Penicillium subrubescens]|uniref:uncharacterized protein n=1 Tax=Penicillium subrubescens TaxID=1316194 RepID=UPI002545AFBD|nr:uncharacterized protein N7473_011040 [Penicillium subrubescens]KAJ5884154.1 hypothetical protein N7473_011040 [Penicillium subrubescens]
MYITNYLVIGSALNLILAFAVSLKHKLRFEPDVAYLRTSAGLIGHLDTFALDAHDNSVVSPHSKTPWKYMGSNPRKLVKRSKKPLGHLPFEILIHLSAYVESCVKNGHAIIAPISRVNDHVVTPLNEILTGTERKLDTPLPAAYSIAISQISLVPNLGQRRNYLIMSYAQNLVGAYIIIGLLFISSEIENPFGEDVNDLPLTAFCSQIAKGA